MSWNEGVKTFIASEDLAARRRVRVLPGSTTVPAEVRYSSLDESCDGITEYAVKAGDQVAVKMLNFPGTQEVYVDQAGLTAGSSVSGGAAGVLTAPTSVIAGRLMEATTAPGIYEVLVLD